MIGSEQGRRPISFRTQRGLKVLTPKAGGPCLEAITRSLEYHIESLGALESRGLEGRPIRLQVKPKVVEL